MYSVACIVYWIFKTIPSLWSLKYHSPQKGTRTFWRNSYFQIKGWTYKRWASDILLFHKTGKLSKPNGIVSKDMEAPKRHVSKRNEYYCLKQWLYKLKQMTKKNNNNFRIIVNLLHYNENDKGNSEKCQLKEWIQHFSCLSCVNYKFEGNQMVLIDEFFKSNST